MGVKQLEPNLKCPSCQEGMRPSALTCDACGLKVEGFFTLNEFARLSADDLHFLRTFVNCEGRIRDMETALGLSYPTVRARLTAFRERISGTTAGPVEPHEPSSNQPGSTAQASTASRVLSQLKRGEISYAEALDRLKAAAAEPAGTPESKGKRGQK
jgi:hypothetical protein